MNKEVRKSLNHVDPFIKSITPFPLDDAKSISNPDNNKKVLVHWYKNNPSTSSCADQNVVSDKISQLYHRITSYPIDSYYFKK